MSEELILEPLADAGEVAKKPIDGLWTYSESTKDVNKIVETNGVTFPIYAKSSPGEQVGVSVDGKPVFEGDRYRVAIDWKDMLFQYNEGVWDTADLKWDTTNSAWDNLAEHNEIKVTNYSSQAIDVFFKVTPAEGFESITYSFDKAANTDDPVDVLRIAAADQGKSGEGEDLNVEQTGFVYLNLHGVPPDTLKDGENTLIGTVTVIIGIFEGDDGENHIGESPYLFSDFDEENHTVSLAGLVNPQSSIQDAILPSIIKVASKQNVSEGKYSVIESPLGTTYTVTKIGYQAFFGSVYPSQLKGSLTLPTSLVSIGDYGIYCLGQLTKPLIIPNSVVSIGDYGLHGCTHIPEIILSNSLKEIGQWALAGCRSLKQITIPSSVETIKRYAFVDDYNLSLITVNKPKDSIAGAPWSAPNSPVATVNWAG